VIKKIKKKFFNELENNTNKLNSFIYFNGVNFILYKKYLKFLLLIVKKKKTPQILL